MPDSHRPDALAFAQLLLNLLDEGRRTATYKLAGLLALIDCCAVGTNARGEAPDAVTTRDLARRARSQPLPGDEHVAPGEDRLQYPPRRRRRWSTACTRVATRRMSSCSHTTSGSQPALDRQRSVSASRSFTDCSFNRHQTPFAFGG